MNTQLAASILSSIESRRTAMQDYLRSLVEIETPSHVPEAQDAIFQTLSKQFATFGYTSLRIPGRETGGYMLSRPAERKRNKHLQLLIGHCDTVWPMGTLDTMKLKESNGQLHGPGVYDMKAGLTQIQYALATLQELDLDPALTPVVLINSDEEIGSRESRQAIERLARISSRAYVLEPPLGLDGKLKTARKGLGHFTMTITGQPAHAGLDPGKGASAILELSHQIQQLFEMNDHDRGITVNVGMIEGGTAANVVAPQCKAVIDVRVLTLTDAEEITGRILTLQPVNKNTTIQIEGGFGRPPMEQTKENAELWEAARTTGRLLGLTLEGATAGGGSDGNITSQYCATLDGLGTVGDGAHAYHEFIYLDKLVERTALLTLLLLLPPIKNP